MRPHLLLLCVSLVFILLGLGLRYYEGIILTDIFTPDTGRELLRSVYSNSLVLAGLLLALFVVVEIWFKKRRLNLVLSQKLLWVVLFAAFIWIRCSYLMQAWFVTGTWGFPLDDAWIHAVYARNFAQTLTLGFIPGVSDAGSSSPLWEVMLSLGAAVRIDAVWNAYLWSNLCWVGTVVFIFLLAKRLLHDTHWSFLTALVVSLHPMLVWNSLAGMETGLFALLIYGAVYCYSRSSIFKWLAVILAGLGGLVRAEGWFLVIAFFVVDLFRREKRAWSVALWQLVLSVLIILPWIAHNYMTNGTILPQTFYAKSYPFSWGMVWGVMKETLVLMLSPGLWVWSLLLPLAIWGWLRHRSGFIMLLPMLITLALVWAAIAGTMGFFWTNHRYMHPFIPVYILFVITGIYHYFSGNSTLRRRIMAAAIAVSLAAGVVSGSIYGYAVKNIEEQQVAMALWVRENVPEGKIVAANDVGALGYFSEHPIYDLNGLVGDGVIWRPQATWDDMKSLGIHWVTIYPEWFPLLSSNSNARVMAQFTVDVPVTVGSNTAVVLFREE